MLADLAALESLAACSCSFPAALAILFVFEYSELTSTLHGFSDNIESLVQYFFLPDSEETYVRSATLVERFLAIGSERKHRFSAKPVPVSAYVGSSKNLNDLNETNDTHRHRVLQYRGTSLIRPPPP